MSTGILETTSNSSISIPKLLAIGSGLGLGYALWRLALKDIVLGRYQKNTDIEHCYEVFMKHCYHFTFGYYIIGFDLTQHETALGRLAA